MRLPRFLLRDRLVLGLQEGVREPQAQRGQVRRARRELHRILVDLGIARDELHEDAHRKVVGPRLDLGVRGHGVTVPGRAAEAAADSGARGSRSRGARPGASPRSAACGALTWSNPCALPCGKTHYALNRPGKLAQRAIVDAPHAVFSQLAAPTAASTRAINSPLCCV